MDAEATDEVKPKGKKLKPLEGVYLKTRSYVDGEHRDVWLIVQEGASHQFLLHGELPEEIARQLILLFKQQGIEVVREKSPFKTKKNGLTDRVAVDKHGPGLGVF